MPPYLNMYFPTGKGEHYQSLSSKYFASHKENKFSNEGMESQGGTTKKYEKNSNS